MRKLSEAYVIRFLALLAILLMTQAIVAQEDFDPLDPTDDDAQMGIDVGIERSEPTTSALRTPRSPN